MYRRDRNGKSDDQAYAAPLAIHMVESEVEKAPFYYESKVEAY